MILDDILAQTRQAVAAARGQRPLAQLEQQLATAPAVRDFCAALGKPGLACIAEFKRRSPSKGWINQDADPAVVASAYQAAGAAAISVLTDAPFFGGSLDDLRRARAAVDIPVLRKDFIVDPYQVAEARVAGADALLLIVSALRQDDLVELVVEVRRLGMEALVETHDRHEVERALAAGARAIGVNHRDLHTFQMDMTLALTMRPLIPPDRLLVAESGIRTPDDAHRMHGAGVDAVLVGERLMREPDPGSALRRLMGFA
ncbi:MAG TPA: indole-3-glycerol phosphate synthase TrpC [Polyangia bacterium]|jgi:Indole-3-glycerol phosphate synthase|nr:indole-3-glycerol phosphate synthase TrpC [Polyangia bacterium]